ncbi:hypothetical protein EW026_g3430 [Hermanssonia centrifuga]|uniref:Septin-type G domain-containing protein n=1 Tax=Hermanssonia centrifuga TaxID=98765 RepID=A0A4S4KK62_9APHY|nr:hypothetical protein EW026_g3430 [Hermanssonia centrifuga]
MDSNEQLSRREQVDFRDQAHANGGRPHLSAAARSLSADRMDGEGSGYTLMVAGRRTGKTAFLRLLLDTSLISPTATQDQLASVAKFVQGCGGYTSHIRTVSVNVDLAVGAADKAELQTLTLTLIDTPSLDFEDAGTGQRTVDEILRHVDARFSDSAEDEHKALTGDQHVHLCVYFLDPDDIVPPPSVSVQPAPMMSRARNNSLSKPELEPVILEPPVTTLPLLCRPTLPQADIATIRRLSARVNVLPVVGRADVLTNDRLTAVKVAVRRDLAAAGIGFGIFDNTPQHPIYGTDLGIIVPSVSEHTNGYNGHAHGSASTASSPPSTPISSTPLPYALISPDIYSHSDGVSRPALSRHELVIQYTPSYSNASMHHSITKIIPQKWTRTYSYGGLYFIT